MAQFSLRSECAEATGPEPASCAVTVGSEDLRQIAQSGFCIYQAKLWRVRRESERTAEERRRLFIIVCRGVFGGELALCAGEKYAEFSSRMAEITRGLKVHRGIA